MTSQPISATSEGGMVNEVKEMRVEVKTRRLSDLRAALDALSQAGMPDGSTVEIQTNLIKREVVARWEIEECYYRGCGLVATRSDGYTLTCDLHTAEDVLSLPDFEDEVPA